MTDAGDRPGQKAEAGRRWDVALSFAAAQRDYVGQVAAALKGQGVRCFYDADEQIELWGAHLAEELPRIYAQESAAVVVFISADYAEADWTRLERRAALARAVAEAGVYVLPARFDDSELPGLLPDVVTVDLRRYTPAQFADLVAEKVAGLAGSLPGGPRAGAGPAAAGRPLAEVSDPFALFVQECGEHDAQPWLDARAGVKRADATLKRHRTPPSRQIRVGTVPQPADCFQDRAVAARLWETAEQDGTIVLTQVLAGTGGVGKTQLAAAYARHVWRQGVGVLVWVNAATRDGVISAYADTAVRLGLPLADRDDPERSARGFVTWAETTDRWWLVVLDDVHSSGDLAGMWPPTVTSAAGGQVVVTTRLREAALAGTGRRMLEVGIFTAEEARSFLHAKLGDRAAGTGQADALAEALGHLPLALAQAAAYISNEDIGIEEYLRRLNSSVLARVVPAPGSLPDNHERIVAATWEMSIGQADLTEPVALARPVLCLASMLDPAGIPAAVLSSPPALEYLTGFLPTSQDAAEVGPEAVDVALRVLHRYSLINHDRTAVYREVCVHQLVQRSTRETLPAPRLDTLAWAAADALIAVWPPVERDELGQVLRASVTALTKAAGTGLWNQDTGGHEVLFRAASSLGRTGQVTAAVTAYADLAATAGHHLGPDHPHTFSGRGNLANWKGEAGDAAGAVAAYEDLLADRLRVQGADHPETLITRNNLANWRGEAGDAAGAVAAYEDLLADRLRVQGADHPGTLITRNNLARWRGEAGDAPGAVAAYEQLLADQERVLSSEHPDTLGTRGNLANWRGEAGDAAGAVAAYEDLLADRLRVQGADHPGTLITRNNLARWRGEAGDAPGAVAAYEQLLADQERVLSSEHPHTLATRGNLAHRLGQAGDAPGAVAAYEQLLADQERVLGHDHPFTLTTCHNLAHWQGQAGDAVGAAAAFEKVLFDRLRVLGPDHPHTHGTRLKLAYWRQRAGLE